VGCYREPNDRVADTHAARRALTQILAIPISVISANFHTEYAKMMKKRGTAAQHRRDLARIQASAVREVLHSWSCLASSCAAALLIQ